MVRATMAVLLAAALILWSVAWGEAVPKEQAIRIAVGAAENEFTFNPSRVSASAGVPVQLTVVNKGKIQHDFHVEALRVTLHLIDPGRSGAVRFTPTKNGTFEFRCAVPGHYEAGMKGTITVK